jgi:pimeloyl-ACP methyl ester carboxylesterase
MLLPVVHRLQLADLRRRGFAETDVETSVGRIRVLDAPGTSTGPPVVILHGIGAAAVHFHAILARLQGRFSRVIAPDCPGHGGSAVPARGMNAETLEVGLFEALNQVLDRPAVLVGNSMGGFAAIRYAAAHPDRLRGLVLVSPGGAGGEDARLDTLMPRFEMADRAAAVDFVRRIHGRPPWYARIIAGDIRREFHRPELRELVSQVSADRLLQADEVSGLRMPILFLWGKRENLLLPEHKAFFLRNLPRHAKIEEPEDFGHCPHLERPGRLARYITDFADSL